MGKKNKKEKAQKTESVQKETVQENKPQINGKVFSRAEFEALPITTKRSNENSIYKSINKIFETNEIYTLVSVYKYLQTISNATNHYKTLWVAFNGKTVREKNNIAFEIRTTATGEKLIRFIVKPTQ